MSINSIKNSFKLFAILILLGLLFSGCTNSMEPVSDVSGIRINMVAKSSGPSKTMLQKTNCHVDSIGITDVGLVISKVKFEGAEVDSTDDFIIEEPHVVRLDLSGKVVPVDTVVLVEGTYEGVKILIKSLDPESPADSVLIVRYPEFANLSFLIKGSAHWDDGTTKDFVFKNDMEYEIEIELSPPLAIDSEFAEQIAGGTAFTIEVDPASWFITSDNRWLDPSNPKHHDKIEKNIKSTLKAFQDKDEDGECDDENHSK